MSERRSTRGAPAVQAFLDGEEMKAVLQARLPRAAGNGLVIRNCVVDSVRYNSRAKDRNRKRPLLGVSYRLDVADRRGRRRGQRIVYAEVYPGRASGLRLVGAPEQTVVRLPEADAVVWEFPHDPQMPHLPEVMDPERAKRHLPFARLPAGLDAPTDAREVRVEVLRYKPETHCAARHEVVWEGNAGPRAMALFGKTYAGDRGDEIHRQIEAVAERSHDDPRSFLAAGSLGYVRSVRTVWQAALAGTPLLPELQRGDCDEILKAVGIALAILHETRPATSLTVTIEDLLSEMRAQIASLVEAFPQLKGALEKFASRLHEEAPVRTPLPATLIHGDFVAKNLLVQDGRPVICDFDDCAVGDPLQDLACFLVDLHFLEDRDSHLVTLRPREPGVVASMASAFLNAYRSRATWRLEKERLEWHWRIQLIAKIQHYFKRQHLRPGFEQDLAGMLALLR